MKLPAFLQNLLNHFGAKQTGSPNIDYTPSPSHPKQLDANPSAYRNLTAEAQATLAKGAALRLQFTVKASHLVGAHIHELAMLAEAINHEVTESSPAETRAGIYRDLLAECQTGDTSAASEVSATLAELPVTLKVRENDIALISHLGLLNDMITAARAHHEWLMQQTHAAIPREITRLLIVSLQERRDTVLKQQVDNFGPENPFDTKTPPSTDRT